ncbi:MAG: hypothetical protein OXH13_07215 [Chloroflexi bacterium]|nr:hypothetical protein [Chloroflexota bacterium]
MPARWRKLRVRDVATFVFVVAVVAIVGVVVGRELGVEREARAVLDAAGGEQLAVPEFRESDLALTISAPPTCEVSSPNEYSIGWVDEDEDGNTIFRDIPTGWAGVAEVPVSWTVKGGKAPYKLMIDGESRDASQDYKGASGTASVSCALRFKDSFIAHESERRFWTMPVVDSGLKTIVATVTDAAGRTAMATAKVYTILAVGSTGDLMKPGETYRVEGQLLTIPKGLEYAVIGGFIEGEGGVSGFSLSVRKNGKNGWVFLKLGTLEEDARSTRPTSSNGDAVAAQTRDPLDAEIDALVASRGKLPISEANTP